MVQCPTRLTSHFLTNFLPFIFSIEALPFFFRQVRTLWLAAASSYVNKMVKCINIFYLIGAIVKLIKFGLELKASLVEPSCII